MRQLNLYNFHKVKNTDGFIEFANDRFRRGQLDSLQFISRKVGNDSDTLKQKLRSPKPINMEYNRLLGIIRNLEISLQAESSKTEQKNRENSELLQRIEKSNLKNSKMTRKLLFIVWMVTTNFDDELMGRVRDLFENSGVDLDYGLFDGLFESRIPLIFDERNFALVPNREFLLDQLLVLVASYHNSKATDESRKVNIDNLLINFEENEQASENAEFAKYLRLGRCAQSDMYSLSQNTLDRMPSVCNFSSSNNQLEQVGFLYERNSRKSRDESLITTFDFEENSIHSSIFGGRKESEQTDFFEN